MHKGCSAAGFTQPVRPLPPTLFVASYTWTCKPAVAARVRAAARAANPAPMMATDFVGAARVAVGGMMWNASMLEEVERFQD